MPTVTLKASDQQRRFLASTADTVVFQGGARSGKTWAGALKALLLAHEYQCAGMLVAPSYPQLKQAMMPELIGIGGELGLLDKWTWNKADNVITFPSGSRIWLRTASIPESLLGVTLGWAVGDEVALWSRQAYDYLQGRISDPSGPRIVCFTFTPKGTAHWTYRSLAESRDGLEVIRATSRDNPTLPKDYHERADRELGVGSLVWRQEVLGEYVAYEGLVYPEFDETLHVKQPPADGIATAIGGIDWGWTNNGVALVIGIDGEGNAWLLEEVVQQRKELSWWAETLQVLTDRYNVAKWYADPSEPGNIEHMRRAHLPVAQAMNEVVPGITAVAGRFASRRLFLAPDCTVTRAELRAYCWKQQRDGTIRNDEPQKVNDHCMDALRYAVIALQKAPRRPAVIFGSEG